LNIGFLLPIAVLWTGRQKGEGFEFYLLAMAIVLLLLVRGAGSPSVDGLLARSEGGAQA